MEFALDHDLQRVQNSASGQLLAYSEDSAILISGILHMRRKGEPSISSDWPDLKVCKQGWVLF